DVEAGGSNPLTPTTNPLDRGSLTIDIAPERLVAGSPAFRRANLAMFVGGYASFAMLYATQPLLPQLAADFAVGAAASSLAVSAGTAAMAVMLIPASVLSDRF